MSTKYVCNIIQRKKDELARIITDTTYGQLARDLDISKGALWKFINTDYIPTSPEIRLRFGIPNPIIVWPTRDPKGRFAKSPRTRLRGDDAQSDNQEK